MAGRVERLRERWAVLDVLVAMVEKGKADEERRLAAEISYYGFFSIFPLLLVFVTVVDIVFGSKTKDQILDSAIGQLPVIGHDLIENVSTPQGRSLATVIGLLTALWAGSHAFESFQHALLVVWQGPQAPKQSQFKVRLRSILPMSILGVAILLTTLAGSVLSRLSFVAVIAKPLGILVSLVLNTAVLLLIFAVMTPAGPNWRRQWPGALFGGIGWTVLQTVGALFVEYIVKGASDTYGTFAVVIGLLTWINIQVRLMLYACEVNSVLSARAGEAVRTTAAAPVTR
jgi:YihY family inner membrane protein